MRHSFLILSIFWLLFVLPIGTLHAQVGNNQNSEPLQVINSIDPAIKVEFPPSTIQVTYNDAEIKCLADAMYFEARGQGEKGETAVASVILNRMNTENYPTTICDVVYQPYQFSWVNDKKLSKKIPNSEYQFWIQAYSLANTIVITYNNDTFRDTTQGALFFDSTDKLRTPKRLKRTVSIGKQNFYKVVYNEDRKKTGF